MSDYTRWSWVQLCPSWTPIAGKNMLILNLAMFAVHYIVHDMYVSMYYVISSKLQVQENMQQYLSWLSFTIDNDIDTTII